MFIVIILTGPVQMKFIPRNDCLPPLFERGYWGGGAIADASDAAKIDGRQCRSGWTLIDQFLSDRDQERRDNRTFRHIRRKPRR